MWCFSLILYYSLQQRSNPKDLDQEALAFSNLFWVPCWLQFMTTHKMQRWTGTSYKRLCTLGVQRRFLNIGMINMLKVRWWQGLHPQSLHLLSKDVQQVMLLQLWLCSPSKLSRMTLYSIIKQESRIVFHRFVGMCLANRRDYIWWSSFSSWQEYSHET